MPVTIPLLPASKPTNRVAAMVPAPNPAFRTGLVVAGVSGLIELLNGTLQYIGKPEMNDHMTAGMIAVAGVIAGFFAHGNTPASDTVPLAPAAGVLPATVTTHPLAGEQAYTPPPSTIIAP